jgi:hypothetical protein
VLDGLEPADDAPDELRELELLFVCFVGGCEGSLLPMFWPAPQYLARGVYRVSGMPLV